jgi:hypothetical protein
MMYMYNQQILHSYLLLGKLTSSINWPGFCIALIYCVYLRLSGWNESVFAFVGPLGIWVSKRGGLGGWMNSQNMQNGIEKTETAEPMI